MNEFAFIFVAQTPIMWHPNIPVWPLNFLYGLPSFLTTVLPSHPFSVICTIHRMATLSLTLHTNTPSPLYALIDYCMTFLKPPYEPLFSHRTATLLHHTTTKAIVPSLLASTSSYWVPPPAIVWSSIYTKSSSFNLHTPSFSAIWPTSKAISHTIQTHCRIT